MTLTTTSGAKVYIATGANANSRPTDATAYAALTWTEVKLVESIGEYGDSSSEVTFNSLSEGRVRKVKGPRDAKSVPIVVGYDPLDPGQIAMIAAEKTKFHYNIRITYDDARDTNDTPSTDYFGGLVMSAAKNGGSADDVTKRTFNIGINTAITEVPMAVVA
jgi:hypothetical protein